MGNSSDGLVTHNQDLVKDLLFLEIWEKGFVPWSTAASVVFRVRQLRRANPDLDDLKKILITGARGEKP
jgi:hypothetical protein